MAFAGRGDVDRRTRPEPALTLSACRAGERGGASFPAPGHAGCPRPAACSVRRRPCRMEMLHLATEARFCPGTLLPVSPLQLCSRAHSGSCLRSSSWLLPQQSCSDAGYQRTDSSEVSWAGRKGGWLHERAENSTH